MGLLSLSFSGSSAKEHSREDTGFNDPWSSKVASTDTPRKLPLKQVDPHISHIPSNSGAPTPFLHVNKVRRRSSLANSETLRDLLNPSADATDERKNPHEETKPLCYRCTRELNERRSASTGGNGSHVPQSNRRRSSILISSLQESLLSGTRISGNKTTPFITKMVISSDGLQSKAVIMPFDAYFPEEQNNEVLPYTGNIDLENYFVTRERKKEELLVKKTSEISSTIPKKRKFPGIEIPLSGQIQLILYNAEKTVCSVILFPYDFKSEKSKISRNNKKIIRQSIYSITTYEADDSKPLIFKKLKSTVEIKVMNYKDKYLFLYDSIKVIFHNRILSNDLPISSEVISKNNDQEKQKRRSFSYPISTQPTKAFPCLPKVVKEREVNESSQSKIDLSYYVNRCHHCQNKAFSKDKEKLKFYSSSSQGKVTKYLSVFSDDEEGPQDVPHT